MCAQHGGERHHERPQLLGPCRALVDREVKSAQEPVGERVQQRVLVAPALGRLLRRPGGELRFLEHVLADRGPLRVLQRLVAPAYSRMPDGCHIDRDTVASIARAGFAIEKCDRFMHADGALEPAIPHVIGTARRSD